MFALGALLAGGVALSACAGSSGALGDRACGEVAHALTLYRQASHATSARVAARERARSLTALSSASRHAALAAAADPSWQALAATLSETSRVPEADVVSALQAQCAARVASWG